MRTMLAALSLAAASGLICSQSAGAVPAAAVKVEAPLQQAQYREYRASHYFVKCYRTLLFGSYHCHYYERPEER